MLTENAEAGSVGLSNGLSHRQRGGGGLGPSLRLWGPLMRQDGINRGNRSRGTGVGVRWEGKSGRDGDRGGSLWSKFPEGTQWRWERAEGLALNKKTDSSPSPRWEGQGQGGEDGCAEQEWWEPGTRRLREFTLDGLVAVVLGSKCSHEANEEFRKSGE